jgi:Ca2+-binding RTX toxin-like protein
MATLNGTQSDDILNGGIENDVLYGYAGADTLNGGGGNDYQNGGAGNDVYLFGRGAGQDTIIEYDGTSGNLDTLQLVDADLTPENVTLLRVNNDLVLSISDTTDKVTLQNWFYSPEYRIEQIKFADGTTWDTTYLAGTGSNPNGSEGNDTIYGGRDGLADSLNGNGGSDSLFALAGNDTIDGGTGDDTMYGGDGHDSLQGGDGNDYLNGDAGDDTMQGGAGNDALYGGSGVDSLIGGLGNDYQNGGAGNDVYLFGRGAGQDTIIEYDGTSGNLDTLQLVDADLTPENVTLLRVNNDLVLSISDTTDKVTLQNWFYSPEYRIEQIKFADGTTWDTASLARTGTNNGETIYGTEAVDALNGAGGNDTIYGYGSNDSLTGGTGNDALYGGAGNDVYLFAAGFGADVVIDSDATAGNQDIIRFAAGIAPSAVSAARVASDLVLTAGTDSITVRDWFATDANKIERVEFADQTVWTAVDLRVMTNFAPTVGTAVADQTASEGAPFELSLPETAFSDADASIGDSLTLSATLADGSSLPAWLTFDAATRTFSGVPDANAAGVLAVKLIATDSSGATVSSGFSIAVADTAPAPAPATLLPLVDEIITGTASADTLDGAGGDDVLYGLAGDDIYVFGRGYGKDAVSDFDTTEGNVDTIRVEGALASDVEVYRDARDLYLRIKGTNDELRVAGWFGDAAYRVERVVFAEGAEWNASFLAQAPMHAQALVGGAYKDLLIGTDDAAESIEGKGGDDTLLGRLGNDTLLGGAGNDMLVGGEGGDIYVFGRGDGQDVIYDYSPTFSAADAVHFAAGIAATDVTLARAGNDLVLSIAGSNDQLTIQGHFDGAAKRIEKVVFADGTVWNDDVLSLGSPAAPIADNAQPTPAAALPPSSPTANAVLGTAFGETLTGTDGNDLIAGQGGDGDYLYGQAGDDVYVFGKNAGYSSISDASGYDTVRFVDGILPSDLRVERDGDSLRMVVVRSGSYQSDTSSSDANQAEAYATIDFSSWFYNPDSRIERVEFADGTAWDGEAIDRMWQAEAGGSFQQGTTADDLYMFGRGFGQVEVRENDAYWQTGGGGNDTVRVSVDVAPEHVLLYRDDTSLYLDIKGTADRLAIMNWFVGETDRVESVQFADGTVWGASVLAAAPVGGGQVIEPMVPNGADSWGDLDGTNGADTLNGGREGANLYGLAGDDLLQGPGRLAGGEGDDVYEIGRGDNAVEIDEVNYNGGPAGGFDTIRFTDGITASDVVAGRLGDELVLRIGDLQEVKVVRQFQTWSDAVKIERIEFADGAVWDATYIDSLPAIEPKPYYPSTAGDDVYTVGLATRSFELYDEAGNDTLRLKPELTAQDLSFVRQNGSLVMTVLPSGAEIKLSSSIEWLQFGDGTSVSLANYEAMAPVVGSEGAETLSGSDLLDDVLDGKGGGDVLQGGLGSDAYVFARGYGYNTIVEAADAGGTDIDAVKLAADILPEQVSLLQDGTHLYLNIVGSDDWLKLSNWVANPDQRVERIEFADSTVWTTADLDLAPAGVAPLFPIVGTDGVDYIGGSGNDVIDAGADDDTVWSHGDTMLFGYSSGRDTLSVDGTLATIRFDAGITQSDVSFWSSGWSSYYVQRAVVLNGSEDGVFVEGTGPVQLQFADGTTMMMPDTPDGLPLIGAYATREGTAGDDVLAAPFSGSQHLEGGAGNDTYLFGRGFGSDVVFDRDGSSGNLDTIRLADDVTPGDVQVWQDGSDLYLQIADTQDRLRVMGWFERAEYRVEQVVFANGTVWGLDVLNAAPAGAPMPFVGGAREEDLYGTAGDDVMDGGFGHDHLFGGKGNDVYILGRGYSDDDVEEYDTTAGNVDTIRLEAGITRDDMLIYSDGRSMQVGIIGTQDEIRVWDMFGEPNYAARVERIEFADGTVIGTEELMLLPELGYSGIGWWDWGTAGNDVMELGPQGDHVSGLAGNDAIIGSDYMEWNGRSDSLYGASGNDLLVGRGGNDINAGVEGNDVVAFNQGDGNDTITGAGTGDTLSLGGGIAYADLAVRRDGDDLVLATGVGDSLTFDRWYASESLQSVSNLQVISEAMAGYNPASGDPLFDHKVEQFDFAGLVAQFDQAMAADPGLEWWNLSSTLLDHHLGGSDTAAIGGDLAYLYGTTGSLADVPVASAQNVLEDPLFGSVAQPFVL